ncbi:hypothetical protein ACQEU8_19225 [Streptomyces sp. CA-250714]|uniref:hypothetical protein n=1 Tax=Streptomyces sp. CA-250714 TaxID=3240060 RepID=UPI003D8D5208
MTAVSHRLRKSSRTKKIMAAVTGLVGLTCAALVTTNAAGAGETPSQHCTKNVSNDEQKCFATYERAKQYAAQEIKDGADSAQTRVEKSSDVVIGTLFTGKRYGGDTLTLWGSRPCHRNGKADFYFNLPEKFQNNLSSFQGWAECDIVLHAEPYLAGESSERFKGLTPKVSEQWNDRAQSVEFR